MVLRSEAEAQTVAPDFSAAWQQIAGLIGREAEGALRVGQLFIEIRDELKPRGLWLATLRERGMSQPQAWRYIEFAELPESEREPYMRLKGFSLTEAIGEGRSKTGSKKPAGPAPDYSSTNSSPVPEALDDELGDRRAEVARCLALATEIVDAGETALADRTDPVTLREVAKDVRALVDEGLEARLGWLLEPQP